MMPTMTPAELVERISVVMVDRGLSAGHADEVARALVSTSLRGVDTHGIRLLPTYVRELEGGRARARPSITVDRSRPGMAVVDGGGALGIVAGLEAARLAGQIARQQGVAWVAVHNSNHFGAASVYALELCRRGLVGIVLSNADALMVDPPGRAPVLGTNPLAVAMPTTGAPFCLDMATSQVAWSRIAAEWKQHGRLPPGWAMDAEGRDCAEAGAGPPAMARPLGGYKGAGLALSIELLCTALIGARFGFDQTHLYGAPWDTPREVAHAIIAVDPGGGGAGEGFRRRVSALLEGYRARAKATPGPMIAPGDLETSCERRRAQGIPVEPEVMALLDGVRERRS